MNTLRKPADIDGLTVLYSDTDPDRPLALEWRDSDLDAILEEVRRDAQAELRELADAAGATAVVVYYADTDCEHALAYEWMGAGADGTPTPLGEPLRIVTAADFRFIDTLHGGTDGSEPPEHETAEFFSLAWLPDTTPISAALYWI